MYKTGVFVPALPRDHFNSKDWGARTTEYVVRISKMKASRWIVILKSVIAALKVTKKRDDVMHGPPVASITNWRELAMPDSDPVIFPSDEI